MIEFETYERLQRAERKAQDDIQGKAQEYSAKKRYARREASDRRIRAAKAVAFGVALAIPFAAALTAPAFGAAGEAADKLQRPALVAVQEVPEPTEAAENELIEAALLSSAHVIENCKITYYDACVLCCGKDDGITASGVQVTPYVTCAVDPAVIPLGSDVMVDYGDGVLHYLRADDTGVAGGHIDICVASHAEALQLGVSRATVYWVE